MPNRGAGSAVAGPTTIRCPSLITVYLLTIGLESIERPEPGGCEGVIHLYGGTMANKFYPKGAEKVLIGTSDTWIHYGGLLDTVKPVLIGTESVSGGKRQYGGLITDGQ